MVMNYIRAHDKFMQDTPKKTSVDAKKTTKPLLRHCSGEKHKMTGRVKYRRRLRPVSTMTYILGSYQSNGVVLVAFGLTCPASYMLNECPDRDIKMKYKQDRACAVPECKGNPSFGPVLPNHTLTFKEAYFCIECKELLVRELIERVLAKNIPLDMLNN
jgi:hypothetical protein